MKLNIFTQFKIKKIINITIAFTVIFACICSINNAMADSNTIAAGDDSSSSSVTSPLTKDNATHGASQLVSCDSPTTVTTIKGFASEYTCMPADKQYLDYKRKHGIAPNIFYSIASAGQFEKSSVSAAKPSDKTLQTTTFYCLITRVEVTIKCHNNGSKHNQNTSDNTK